MSDIIQAIFLHGLYGLLYKRFQVTKQKVIAEIPLNVHDMLLLDK
ncbi:MAG: hypothetical protein ACI9LX_001988 [Paraglaciecola sp.]|jgi:hypothetical protein